MNTERRVRTSPGAWSFPPSPCDWAPGAVPCHGAATIAASNDSRPHFLSDVELDVPDEGVQRVPQIGMANLL